MVTLEQIKLLDNKVHEAVTRIDALNKENSALKSKLETYQHRIDELEKLIETFKKDQGEIEEGIKSALDELNKLEDDLSPGSESADQEAASARSDDIRESGTHERAGLNAKTGGAAETQVSEPQVSETQVSEAQASEPPSPEPDSTPASDEDDNEQPEDEETPRSGELDIF